MSNNRKTPSIIEQHPEGSGWKAEYDKCARAATDPIATLDKVEEWIIGSLGAGHRQSWRRIREQLEQYCPECKPENQVFSK
ncbi:hypothetical protein [Chitinophaga eiseniae]|uniref:hypothetical protein n=1 Tax=Chitinophaga eiseniae TaxID=634771 RepID=UPI0009996DAA|nr:hypothetical protein [Chitinophaga eiseniae]